MERSHIIDIIKKLYRITLLFPKKEPLRYRMREVANDILADFIKQEDEKEKPIDRKDSAFFLVENLDILNSYFAIAEEQKWVSSQNLLPLWQQYDDLMEYAKGLTQKIQIAPSLFLEDKIESSGSQLASDPISSTAPMVIEKENNSLLVVENNNEIVIDGPDKENEANILETANKQRQVQSVKVSPRQEKIIDFLKANGRGQVGEFKSFFPDITKRTLRRDFMFLLKQGIIERKGEKNNTFYTAKVA